MKRCKKDQLTREIIPDLARSLENRGEHSQNEELFWTVFELDKGACGRQVCCRLVFGLELSRLLKAEYGDAGSGKYPVGRILFAASAICTSMRNLESSYKSCYIGTLKIVEESTRGLSPAILSLQRRRSDEAEKFYQGLHTLGEERINDAADDPESWHLFCYCVSSRHLGDVARTKKPRG